MPRAQKDFNELCQKFVWRLNITDDMEYFRRLLSVSMKYGVTFFNGYLAEFVYH